MRVAIITYTRTKNYGGILQAYGLYSYLCEIITVFTNSATRLSKIWGCNNLTKKLWQKLRYPVIKAGYKPFLDFLNDRAKFTAPYYSMEELVENPPQADVYITGSDQVWNSSFLPGEKVDEPFYLGFTKGKKISYASSFGKTSIPDKNIEEVSSYLKQYMHLSVREESGREILGKLDLESEVVVDPTMLCDFTVWDKLTVKVPENDYVLLYQVRHNAQIYEMACSTAQKMGKQLITLSMNPQDKKKIRQGLIMTPTIPEWLSYIKSADYVITDSFHAGVFSILFHKKFLVNSGVRKGMSSRIQTLLKMTDLRDRELNDFSVDMAMHTLEKEIDWVKSDEMLKNKRNYSRGWLERSINV